MFAGLFFCVIGCERRDPNVLVVYSAGAAFAG